ncbi:hypothetical protein SAURM35S_09189 [Streptomyces aurantiogriseus]
MVLSHSEAGTGLSRRTCGRLPVSRPVRAVPERHRRAKDSAAAAASSPLRTSISVTPVQVQVVTSWYSAGYTAALTAVAAVTSAATGRCVVCREVRHTAARPSSQIMYCGLMTRLVTVNSSTALSAASCGVVGVQCRQRSRHRSSRPNATAVLPLVLVSRNQSAQVGWLPVPDWESVERLLRGFAAGPRGVVFWGCVVLMAVGFLAGRAAAFAAPLMLVPPGILMLLSQVRPLYHDRYVLYALAGAPLLIAAGADRLARIAGRRSRSRAVAVAGVLAVSLVFLHVLPLHRHYRTPAHRPDNLASVSALAARQVRPGDPVLFLPSLGRRAALAYPKGFQGVRDLALEVPGARSGTLYGREVGPGELRRRLAAVNRVWVVAAPYALGTRWYPRDLTERVKLVAVEEWFVPASESVRDGVTLRLYVRRPATGSPAVPEPPRRPVPR